MIGFLLTVGPKEGGIAVQAIQSILRHYHDAKIWVRDDATTDGSYELLKGLADQHPDRIDLARNPQPMGYRGIPVSIFRSYHRIANAPEKLEMLIQLDPDVWLRDGIDELARKKFAEQGPGIVGSYMRSPSQTTRSHSWHRNNMIRDLFPLGWDKATKKFRAGFPFYLPYLSTAMRNGYKPGHHVLGAFYIMSGETLYALEKVGFWDSMPDAGSRIIKEDDPLVSIGAFIVGHKLIELHDEGTPKVWIQVANPLPFSAQEILERNYMAVHPLKYDERALAIRRELAEATAVA
ncbi:hypothetical protein [Silvibacterium sp.]|uniref:hypothetical protein n=1 Tax=Silvibacterium sp. TaxID=1964179 RepID=UPI0039E32924